MTLNDISNMHAHITQLRNVAILCGILFKPIEQLKEENNWTEDKAIERKEKAYRFLKKYSQQYITTAVDNLRDIANKEYDIIQHKYDDVT